MKIKDKNGIKSGQIIITLLIAIMITSAAEGATGTEQIRKVDFNSLTISDPFILADPVTKIYYMAGSGGAMWKSPDLKTWEGPYSVIQTDPNSWMGPRPSIWAAEIHYYKGKYLIVGLKCPVYQYWRYFRTYNPTTTIQPFIFKSYKHSHFISIGLSKT